MSQSSDPSPSPRVPTLDELWRRALGRRLRELRLARGERLDDTAARAGISPQYLSEVERGRKDASSEMIAAVIGALDSTLAEILVLVADGLRVDELRAGGAEVIDIRSLTSVGRSTDAGPPGLRAASEPLLLAA